MIGIYKITNPEGKIYIGQSKDIEKRWKQYYCISNRSQRKLYDSFITYGVKNHNFEVIEECIQKDLNQREIWWQNELSCFDADKGLNLNQKSNYKMVNKIIDPVNERNAGRKSKFTKPGKLKDYRFTRTLPEKGKEEIMKAWDEVTKQFLDHDWT